MKRLVLGLALVVAVVVGAVVVSTGSARTGGKTIHLIATSATSFGPKTQAQVKPGVSGGFTDVISGDSNGRDAGTCTFVNKQLQNCTFNIVLKDGQLAFQGVFDYSKDTQDIPLVGGSGAYDGASGHVTVKPINNTKTNLTISMR
jgi:hypothetical protein